MFLIFITFENIINTKNLFLNYLKVFDNLLPHDPLSEKVKNLASNILNMYTISSSHPILM